MRTTLKRLRSGVLMRLLLLFILMVGVNIYGSGFWLDALLAGRPESAQTLSGYGMLLTALLSVGMIPKCEDDRQEWVTVSVGIMVASIFCAVMIGGAIRFAYYCFCCW